MIRGERLEIQAEKSKHHHESKWSWTGICFFIFMVRISLHVTSSTHGPASHIHCQIKDFYHLDEKYLSTEEAMHAIVIWISVSEWRQIFYIQWHIHPHNILKLWAKLAVCSDFRRDFNTFVHKAYVFWRPRWGLFYKVWNIVLFCV